MKFCINPLTFDGSDTNAYGWLTHTCMCQPFGEIFQNAMKLHTSKLYTIGNMSQKYQLNMVVTHLCMGDTYAYVSLLTQLHIGGFDKSKSTTRHIHLCTMMRGMCVQGLVRKCGLGQEIETVLYLTHIQS